MKRIGILGGLGPESTVDYYKEIITVFNTKYTDSAYPEIIVYSANLKEFMGFVEAGLWNELSAWLMEKIVSLYQAGAEFAAIASNTPHIVFNEIQSKSPIPVLSIVEATCRKTQAMGLKNIGLLGTRITMAAEYYKIPFLANGISVVVPLEAEQQLIHQKLFSEIELGIFKDETRDQLLAIVKRMVEEHQIDSLVLGCTELPLILTENKYGIPFLNTTQIHCERIINYCLKQDSTIV